MVPIRRPLHGVLLRRVRGLVDRRGGLWLPLEERIAPARGHGGHPGRRCGRRIPSATAVDSCPAAASVAGSAPCPARAFHTSACARRDRGTPGVLAIGPARAERGADVAAVAALGAACVSSPRLGSRTRSWGDGTGQIALTQTPPAPSLYVIPHRRRQ